MIGIDNKVFSDGTDMKVACVQMNSSRDIAANIAKLQAWVKDAAAQGAQLVATPENTFVMGEPAEGEMRQFYTQENHPGVAAAAAMARENGCWLLIGSVAVVSGRDDDNKTYNRSLLFDPQGQVAASYDKIHLFDVVLPNGEVYTESARMLAGKKAVVATVSPSPCRGEGRGESEIMTAPTPSLTLPPAGGGNARKTELCSTALTNTLRPGNPRSAVAFASVPDAVKTTSFGQAATLSAMILRAFSRCFFASRPSRCTDDGFSASACNSCIRARACGRRGAVAL